MGPEVRFSPSPLRLQHLSHVGLIKFLTSPSRPNAKLDAIIVPAARPARNLRTAVDLAATTGCHLIVLCSKQASATQVRRIFAAKNFELGIALRIPEDYSSPYLQFKTSAWMKGPGEAISGGRRSDLSTKRNIGLLVALMRGWKRILFLDDDVRGISVDDLDHTASLLGVNGAGDRSVGMLVRNFPDNSIVCHARRELGEQQDVFITGSVLAVDCTAQFGFFPDIYNEDWLFLYQDAKEGKLASPGLHATQIKYNPFTNPQRAAQEEFGDLIAEGLYSLLHQNLEIEFTDEEYWKEFIASRFELLEDMREHLAHSSSPMRIEIEKAVLIACDTLENIDSRMCVEYLSAWQDDLLSWKRNLEFIPHNKPLSEAFQTLGLTSIDPCA